MWAWDVSGPGEVARNGISRSGGTLLVGLPGFQLFDSLAVDGDGYVVVGTLVNGGLTIVSPDGASVDHMALPDFMVTNVCFGGDDLRTAYVTCSATGTIVSFPPGPTRRTRRPQARVSGTVTRVVDDTGTARPDLLLIMTDQQRFDQVGYASGGHFETPTLDALAAQGVIFDTAYSASTVSRPAWRC